MSFYLHERALNQALHLYSATIGVSHLSGIDFHGTPTTAVRTPPSLVELKQIGNFKLYTNVVSCDGIK